MLSVRFLFIGEGTTDDELVGHLERCCVLAGADEANGVAPDFSRLPHHVGRTVAAKLRAALALEPNVDSVFVHRDADSRDPQPRHDEIHRAVREVSDGVRYVAVVPVQETEAWLMLDEGEVRSVAEPEGPRSSEPPDPVDRGERCRPQGPAQGNHPGCQRADRATARTDKQDVRSEEEAVDTQARSRRSHP